NTAQPGTLAPQGQTEEISQDRWNVYLTTFTQENRGAHGQLEVLGDQDVPRVVEIENKPFDGISADVKDGEHTVWILFGTDPGDRITHGVRNAVAIRVRQPVGDSGAAIEIDSQEGTK